MKQRRRGGSAAKNVPLSRTRARGVRAGRAGVRVRGSAGGSAPWASGRRGWRRKRRRSRGRLRLGAIPARCHPSPPPSARTGRFPSRAAGGRAATGSSRPGAAPLGDRAPHGPVGRPGTPRGPCQPLRVTLHAVSLGHSTPEPGRGGAEGSQPLARPQHMLPWCARPLETLKVLLLACAQGAGLGERGARSAPLALLAPSGEAGFGLSPEATEG